MHGTRSSKAAFAALLAIFVLLQSLHAAAQPPRKNVEPQLSEAQQKAAEEAFNAGVAHQEQKQYAEALAEYRKVEAIAPGMPSVLWNGGICAYFVKDYPYALNLWRRLKSQHPVDGTVRAKLILVYQAMGDKAARAKERAELVALRKSKKDPKLSANPSFCCDQFVVGGTDVYAYDFFELTGPRALRYNFLVLKPDGTTDYRISVGSYDFDNDLAREMGHLKAGHRLYHLDGYYNQGKLHKTFQFYDAEPTYDAARKDVIAILQGAMKEKSSSVRP